MTNTRIEAPGIAPPAAAYAHGVKSSSANSIIHTSGVVPVMADGAVPTGIVEQARTVWSNISAILIAGGMGVSDIVSVTTYVVPDQDMAAVMAERDRALGGHLAASTLVIVAQLAQAAWKVEISVVAAK